MADVTVKHMDDLEGYQDQFLYVGKGLGVTAWGMNLLRMPPGWPDYPEHDHAADGQEEVYVVISGDATLQAEEKSWRLEPGMFARVGPAQKRKIVPGERGVTLLALGGTPGKAFEAS